MNKFKHFKNNRQAFLSIFIVLFLLIGPFRLVGQLRTGADSLVSDMGILEGKKFALCVNHTSVLSNGEFLIDHLIDQGLEPEKLFIFTPEHGLKGLAVDGEKVYDTSYRDVKVISLYGKNLIPPDSIMQLLDLIIYDVQDVGLRFYTYISTLKNIMIACAKNDKELWILDRPNPLGGAIVEGPIVVPAYMSFVGSWPIPVRYGLSVGELALMGVGEKWIDFVELNVIPYSGLNRADTFLEWGRSWAPTSPNLPDFETVSAYVGMCLWEGTMISEGRGTLSPFLLFGMPDSNFVKLDDLSLDSSLHEVSFIPKRNKGSKYPKYRDENCYGYALIIPVPAEGMINSVCEWIEAAYSGLENYSGSFFLKTGKNYYLDLLLGSDSLRKSLINKRSVNSLFPGWRKASADFKQRSKKYWLYN